MTRSALAIAMATVLIGYTALAQDLSTLPPTQSSIAQPSRDKAATGTTSGDLQANNPNGDTINRSDERFLKDFAQITAAEVYTGTTAEYKAEDAEVKAFAKHMVDIHSKTIGKVKTIAAKTRIDVKAKPAFMQRTKSAILDINVGGSFDRAYMKAMVTDHEKVVEMLEKEIKDGRDANVKQLASDALSDAQKHLQMAQDLRAKVFAEQNAHRSLARNGSGSAEKVATNR